MPGSVAHMKLVVRVKLLPTPQQALALEATMRTCNEAATWLAARAFEDKVFSRAGLQALAYGELKMRGLSAQPALHVLRKVADAYTTLKANEKAGNLGKPGSKRYVKGTGKPIAFRGDAAQPFDDRCLSWKPERCTVSIWTTSGRMKHLAYTGGAEQLALLQTHRRGESDLLCQGGQWYLMATCEIPEAAPNAHPVEFVGVDLGIVNIATTSAGKHHGGRRVNRTRERDRRLRDKPWKISRASAIGYGSGSPNASSCTHGRFTNSARSLHTRRSVSECRWCTWIRRTPAENVPGVITSTSATGPPRLSLRVGSAASLSMPT